MSEDVSVQDFVRRGTDLVASYLTVGAAPAEQQGQLRRLALLLVEARGQLTDESRYSAFIEAITPPPAIGVPLAERLQALLTFHAHRMLSTGFTIPAPRGSSPTLRE